MKLTITINLDNAAFEDPSVEVERILTEVVRRGDLWTLPLKGPIHDSNGNTVGKLEVTE